MPNDEAERLRRYIAEAREQGIERLPPEPRLSEALEVTRGRLRTLLKKVEEEGLIWRHVGKGTFVGQRKDPVVFPSVASSVSVDQVIQARSAIEPQLAALAAMHATTTDLEAMEHCLAEMEAAQDFDNWKALDDRLHRIIADASHNMLMVLLYDTLKSEVALHMQLRMEALFGPVGTSSKREQTEQQHRGFVDAIRMHDPERAERLMRAHIMSVRTKLFGDR